MKTTDIQWCHSTINPVMGCDGCELWPPAATIRAILLALLLHLTALPEPLIFQLLAEVLRNRTTSEVYREREGIAAELANLLKLDRRMRQQVVDVIRRECKCYAGLLGTNRAGHKGYADKFELPQLYPGRVAEAAGWRAPSPTETTNKPWLAGCSRLIFVSDMGDALSKRVPFEFLTREIIENVTSVNGRNHVWLWLSKRPGRMGAGASAKSPRLASGYRCFAGNNWAGAAIRDMADKNIGNLFIRMCGVRVSPT